MTKQFKIALVVLLLASVALAAGNYYVQRWTDIKMSKVSQGLAESTFPWRDYTEAELAKMYPQIRYADVPTRVTPEQTYAKFRQALKDNNLDMAVEQLSKSSGGRYRDNKKSLEEFYNEKKFGELYKYYNEKIIKSWMSETIAQYDFDYYSIEYNRNLVGTMEFIKDANGDWKIDNL